MIKGSKVLLRPITSEDTQNIIKWRNTEFVRDNFIFRKNFTEEMHIEWLDTKIKTGEAVQYIITDLQLMPIGSVYFRNIDNKNKTAEFGIFIGEKDYIGKGYGQEAASMFVEYGFYMLNLEKIILRVIDSNKRAIHLYEKIGFRKIGTETEISQPLGNNVNVVFMEIDMRRIKKL